MKTTHLALMAVAAITGMGMLATGCNDSSNDHIQVQHILIAFKGTIPKPTVTRTQADAEKLANSLFEESQKPGADFGALVAKNTDDSPPGIYGMSNSGVTPNQGEYGREQMVPAFGDVGFKLKVGEIGFAKYDQKSSPFGYHIIKRVK